MNHVPSSTGRIRVLLGSQYFLYFGVMGVYLPYFNLYCYHLDFSGAQIGMIAAIKSFTMVLMPVLWATIADHFQIRRPIYIACNFMSTAVWVLYFFTVDYQFMLVITFLYGIFHAPIISFLEAFTMDLLGSRKKRYGNVRLWGSLAFIAVSLSIGRLIDLFSIQMILGLIFGGSLTLALVALRAPSSAQRHAVPIKNAVAALLHGRVIIFLVCAFLMLVSHGAYYGFYSIRLENLGYSRAFIGLTWALASIAEISIMANSERLFKRFDPAHVLIFSFMAAACRWFILMEARTVVVILAAQVMHAATYGAFHIASIIYVDQLSPDGAKTMGQALNNAATYGLGLMVGFYINGYLYEWHGASFMFFISGLTALTGGGIFFLWWLYVKISGKNQSAV